MLIIKYLLTISRKYSWIYKLRLCQVKMVLTKRLDKKKEAAPFETASFEYVQGCG